MIAHALTIVCNELDRHLREAFQGQEPPYAVLGNIAEMGSGTNNTAIRDRVVLSVINIQEERALKNISGHIRDEVTMRVRYEHPPTLLNLAVLAAATHTNYTTALNYLSRALAFFQSHPVFTPESVDPSSLADGAPNHALDLLEDFRVVFNLWSPSMEEVNDMWGMLGGKQFPFALFSMRMLELKFRTVNAEGSLITEVVNTVGHRGPGS